MSQRLSEQEQLVFLPKSETPGFHPFPVCWEKGGAWESMLRVGSNLEKERRGGKGQKV